MQGSKKNRSRRAKSLVMICAFSAILLVVSTYAWFVGMRTVNVNPFDVEIVSTESLLLSLDANKWSDTVSISGSTLDSVSYTGHTNSWGGTGLIPMSTIGDMDTTASRLKLYEKASVTPTAGGYRLLASRVDNYNTGEAEKKGYVAFDLFVKNFSGTQYIVGENTDDEEAIYLTTNSAVKVAADGVEDTGIENSVRVAFAQIGRVKGTVATPATIYGITCTSNGTCTGGTVPTTKTDCESAHGIWTPTGEDTGTCAGGSQQYCDSIEGTFSYTDSTVTGLCRKAQIWEPNDKAHVDDAISWYTTSCRKRTAATVADSSYTLEGENKACSGVIDNQAYNTYAIARAISSADGVDVYDGYYNTYAGNVGDGTTSALHAYDYFTDTEKMEVGTARPQFMTLAPNSITKIRIYVYIEGQDIDNYDFAQIGKKISVNFGFTKERFDESDINYDGPAIDGSSCEGGEIPTSETACETAYGYWTGSKCVEYTKEYCEAIGGTYTPGPLAKGTCTGTAPTSKAACESAFGTWTVTGEDTGTCSGNTKRYCDAIEGTFVLSE